MPELPEVETVVRGLQQTVVGETISRVSCRYPKIDADNAPLWRDTLEGRRIMGVRRRGKNILMDLSGGWTLWVHLKMTGHLYFLKAAEPLTGHDLLVFELQGRTHQLRFNDVRRFGRVRLFPTATVMDQKGLVDLGPEPLEIAARAFSDRVRGCSRMIKPALLDQRFLAGVGNIYADESLFLARLHPQRRTSDLSVRKARELHRHLQQILQTAIANMGTSVDSYAGVYGQPGGYQKYLVVYGRRDTPCPRCGAVIRREVIGSRSAHFCPRCQRL